MLTFLAAVEALFRHVVYVALGVVVVVFVFAALVGWALERATKDL